MFTLPVYKLALLTAVEKGIIDPAELQDFLDHAFNGKLFPVYSELFKGLIYLVKVDDVEMYLMSDNGEVELTVLREEEGKERQEIIEYQIALWKMEKKNRQLEKEIELKKSQIEASTFYFDQRVSDARNLISCYEEMVSKFENVKATVETVFDNVSHFEGDEDGMLTLLTLIAVSIQNISTAPTDYNPIPF